MALLACGVAAPCRAGAATQVEFDLAATDLDEALQRLSMQAGVQILYEQALVSGKRSVAVAGRLALGTALRRLLADSGLAWRFVDDTTIVIQQQRQPGRAARQVPASPRPALPGDPVVEMGDVDVHTDRLVVDATSNSSVFGFHRSLLETPRSATYIGEETIDAFGLSAVEDLAGLAPGVFTTTRFGIQGSVDVRNVPADTYFRGMKRLTLQGHGRSVLAALDSMEIVGGPASPLYGLGKIGGYTNVLPKSGRAQSGKYLARAQGFVQAVGGRYERRELSFGLGGPLSLLRRHDRQGGYYLYGLLEDSHSYTEHVPVRQKLLQAASSIDDVAGTFRLESGINFQESRTAGALLGRLNQALVDSGRYISGVPLVNLDLDGSGSIDFQEMNAGSPVTGKASPSNQPLAQSWAWPTGADGRPLATVREFPLIPGIPRAMHDYLVAHPQADPTGLLRAQGPGGPLPMSGAVPVGLSLDPTSVRFSILDPRHSSAYERDSNARFFTAYADLVRDRDPDFTIKNQLFFDSMNQYKLSDQPLHQIQNVSVVEDKLTLTRRIGRLPPRLRAEALLTANLRNTVSSGRTKTGLSDFANHRSDAMTPFWSSTTAGMTPNSTFAVDAFPWTSIYRTRFSEMGAGALFDVGIGATSLMLGGRYDSSRARNTEYAGRFDVGSSRFTTTDDTVSGRDGGSSWSFSLSQALPHSLHPYVTLAESSVMLDGSNNSLSNAIIRAGHVGAARLREAGIKANLLQQSLFVAASVFEQARVDVSEADDVASINAYATATITRGWQAEMRWSPHRELLLSAYALHQSTHYKPNIGGAIQVDAAALGFRDVVDAAGNVVYPANAFLYGGRVRILLPNDLPAYRRKQGNPDWQAGLFAVYRHASGLGFTLKGNYLSGTCSGRLCLVELPSSRVLDASVFRETRNWDVKLAVFNLTDEHYFRARTGDTLGDVIAQAMPGRRWQATLRYKY